MTDTTCAVCAILKFYPVVSIMARFGYELCKAFDLCLRIASLMAVVASEIN